MPFLTKLLPVAALAALLSGGVQPADAAGPKAPADRAEALTMDDALEVGDRRYYGPPRGYHYGPPRGYYRPPPPRYYYPPPAYYAPPPRVYYPPPPRYYYPPPQPGVGLYFRF
jgi:hypothetical protein